MNTPPSIVSEKKCSSNNFSWSHDDDNNTIHFRDFKMDITYEKKELESRHFVEKYEETKKFLSSIVYVSSVLHSNCGLGVEVESSHLKCEHIKKQFHQERAEELITHVNIV